MNNLLTNLIQLSNQFMLPVKRNNWYWTKLRSQYNNSDVFLKR